MLRACYRTKMRLHTDPTILTPVRWYRTRPGVPPWNVPTPFVSQQWRTEPWRDLKLGEVWDEPRPFDHGFAPRGADGERICGKPEWFRTGQPYPDTLPPAVYTRSGLLACCVQHQFFQSSVPVVIRGRAVTAVIPTTPPSYTAPVGTTFQRTLFPNGPGQWNFSDGFSLYTLLSPARTLTGDWELTISISVFLNGLWSTAGSWDGTGLRTFDFVSGVGFSGTADVMQLP